ncbi:MAG: EAL domain-containing protein [Motiliproteus sp.]
MSQYSKHAGMEITPSQAGALLSHVPAILWGIDYDRVIAHAVASEKIESPSSCEDWVGAKVDTIFSGCDSTLQALQQALIGEQVSVTTRLKGRWYETSFTPEVGPEGLTHHVSAISIDITEHQANQTQLQILSQVVEQGPAAVIITDAQGYIEYVNPAFTRRMGYSTQDLLGQTPRIIKASETPALLYQQLWQTIKAGKLWRGELLNRAKCGRAVYESQTIAPIKNSSGEISHFVSIKEDVSELRRSETELRRYNRMLRIHSGCNQALLHSETEEQLFDQICRLLTKIGEYPLVWIGSADGAAADSIEAVAVDGHSSACIKAFAADFKATAIAQRCIHGESAIEVLDLNSSELLAWCPKSQCASLNSAIAIPVVRPGQQIFSLIWILSTQSTGFAPYERQLFHKLAADFGLGLEALRTQRALDESEAQFRSLAEDSMVGVYMIQDGRFVYANPRMSELFGYPLQQLIGEIAVLDLVAPQHRERVTTNLGQPLNGHSRSLHYSFSGLRSDGEEIQVEVFGAYTERDGKPSVVGSLVDISERQRLENQLKLMQRAIESSSNGVAISDVSLPDNPFVYVNAAFESITGYPRDQVLGKNGRFLLGRDFRQPELDKLRFAFKERKSTQVILRNYHQSGSMFWNELAIAPVRGEDQQVTHYVSVLNDISERKNYEHQLEQLSNYDALTGLANKNLLRDRLQQSIIQARRRNRYAALVLIDLDRFRMLTQSVGITVSDAVLKQVGSRISGCVRNGDTVARIESDDFAVVLCDVASVDDISVKIQQIISAINQPLDVGPSGMALSCSIGISVYPQDGKDPHQLIRNAEAALFKSMERQNCFNFYTPSLNATAHERLQLEVELRAACQRQEFVLYYQPKVDLRSGQISGAEALIRWIHPSRGLVPPNDFIPVAEDTGLIREMGNWVISEACRAIGRINRSCNRALSVAVNISAKQFNDDGLIQYISSVLSTSGIAPELLECELTESMLMDDPGAALVTLTSIKQTGVRVALDDFGTGYSSLVYLKRFPIDTLKIDRSFIKDLAECQQDQAITQAIIALADSLGLYVVAEGVETQQQQEFLKTQECDAMQGFLFSKPLPEEQFLALLQQWPQAPIMRMK